MSLLASSAAFVQRGEFLNVMLMNLRKLDFSKPKKFEWADVDPDCKLLVPSCASFKQKKTVLYHSLCEGRRITRSCFGGF